MDNPGLWDCRKPVERRLRILLVGPYDPNCGEYTFLAPPLGVWRLSGFIESLGHEATVFDPNCCTGSPEPELQEHLTRHDWDIVGISTTGMTLRFDLALAHLAHRYAPSALLIAGGMEATFDPGLLFRLAPLDLVILGEGEKPLLELISRLRAGEPLCAIPGTAVPLNSGGVQRFHGKALDYTELRESIELTPYERMPYESYWNRLERAYRVGQLPYKAEREARLAEVRSVRLITLNYCPMACTFCSSTNFLHSAQGSIAKIARLTAQDCLAMIKLIVAAQPRVKTIIFQDDIFVFTNDKRILELCEGIQRAKAAGEIPVDLQFISTNRIDAMTAERLRAMKHAGFRVVGFGVESFSKPVLEEFNKGQIFRHIEPVLSTALRLGLKPFLDLILCSPRSELGQVAETIRQAYRWTMAGCEIGLYPYVVPFSGSQMAGDAELAPYVTSNQQTIQGTNIAWSQPDHILPIDPRTRGAMQRIVTAYEEALEALHDTSPHIPSRARSLLWIGCAIPVLQAAGEDVPDSELVLHKLDRALYRSEIGGTTDTATSALAERVACA